MDEPITTSFVVVTVSFIDKDLYKTGTALLSLYIMEMKDLAFWRKFNICFNFAL